MLWWFAREGKRTTIEVLDLPAGGYELRFVDADGTEHVEQFTSAKRLAERQQAIQDALIARGWRRSGEWLV